MTRQPHDQFAKQYLKELLSPFGKVEISREVTGEVRPFHGIQNSKVKSQNLDFLGSKFEIQNSKVKSKIL